MSDQSPNAEELRKALDLWEQDHQVVEGDPVATARSLAHAVEFLPLVEAAKWRLALYDEATVEKVLGAISDEVLMNELARRDKKVMKGLFPNA